MALSLDIRQFPGYQIMKKLYDALPGSGIVKKVVVGLVIGGIVAGVVGAGIAFFIGAGAFILTLPLLVQLGVIITLTAIFTLVITAVRYILNFDWNQSDKEIEQKIKDSFNSFYSLIGEFSGQLVGYLVCGAIPGALSFAFNRTVAASIMSNLTEEAKDELLGQLSALAMNVFSTLVNAMILKGFSSARKWIKRPGTPFHDIIKKKLGAKRFEEWGKEGSGQYTITGKIEEKVESIQDPRLRNFTEEFLEGFSEACIESGYIIVNTIESHMAAQAMVNSRMGLSPDEEVVRINLGGAT